MEETYIEVGEDMLPRYLCDCGAVDFYEALFPTHENHAPFTPVDLVGAEVECINGCEQDGCTFSDCVHGVQLCGQCPECGGPARVRITSTPVRYEM